MSPAPATALSRTGALALKSVVQEANEGVG
jgi:hypothetical protein